MSTRDDYVASLRAFADWLEHQGPEGVEVTQLQGQRFLIALSTNPPVEEFARKHKADVQYDDEGNASCSITFGSITCQAYGYADFAQHIRQSEEKYARRWADENDMAIVPAALPHQRNKA